MYGWCPARWPRRSAVTEVDAAIELLSGDANKVLLVPSRD
jgi:hypothetical protein